MTSEMSAVRAEMKTSRAVLGPAVTQPIACRPQPVGLVGPQVTATELGSPVLA